MYRKFLPTFLVAILLFIVVSGCHDNPTVPDSATPDDIALSAQVVDHNHHPLGFYELIIDTVEGSIDVVSIRAADLHLNVVGILNQTMGVTAVGVPSEADPPNGLFAFDITLAHPFGTKPQFAGFDVKGILMTPGTFQVFETFEPALVMAGLDETQLENADGYTRWWNPAEFTNDGMFGYTHGNLANSPGTVLTATVNPYKYFADALDTTMNVKMLSLPWYDSDTGRGVFAAGSSNTRRYMIRFPMTPGPQVKYGYAIDAAWNLPSPNPPGEIPDDFPANANQPEGFIAMAEPVINTLFYDTESATFGGVCRLEIDVRDWQGIVSGDIDAEIDEVLIYAPDLFEGPDNASFVEQSFVKADYVYEIRGDGITIPSDGEFLGALRVAIEDDLQYNQGVGPAPDEDICAWNTFLIEVEEIDCVTDDNNIYSEAVQFFVNTNVEDYLCAGTDDEDWYKLVVPPGVVVDGEFYFYCDDPSAGITIHDVNGVPIVGTMVTDGLATIYMDSVGLGVGVYYISAFVSGMGDPVTYLLEHDGGFTDITPVSPVDVTPIDLFLDPNWVDRHDTTLFFKGLMGFWSVDNVDPLNPRILSYTRNVSNPDPAFCYPYLYHWKYFHENPNAINFIDYTDPANPVINPAVMFLPYETKYAVMNSENLYFAVNDGGGGGKILIYDISIDPANPTLVDEFDTYENVIRLGLLDPDGNNTALVVLSNTQGKVFDVEDPANITSYAQWMLNESSYNDLDIEGNFLFLTTQDLSDNGYLNISEYDPGVGFDYRGHIYTSSHAEYVDVEGDYVYVGGGHIYGLQTLEWSDPDNPTWLGADQTVSASGFVYADPDLLINIPIGSGYTLFDKTDPANPEEIYRYPCLNQPLGVGMIPNFAVFSEGTESYHAIKVLNIVDPSNAFVVGELLLDDLPLPMVNNGEAFAVAGVYNNRMTFVNLADPTAPSIITWTDYSDNIGSMAINDDVLYVGVDDLTLDIWLMNAWPIPIHKTPKLLNAQADAMVIADDWLYVGTAAGVDYYDISDVTDPVYTGTFGSAAIYQLKTGPDRLYILDDTSLIITDISGGGLPVTVGSTLLPYTMPPDLMTIEGEYAYVKIEDWMPITAVHIYPESTPTVYGDISSIADAWFDYNLEAHMGYLYESQYAAGVKIWDLY